MDNMYDKIKISKNDSYRLGVHRTDSGFSFAYASDSESVKLHIYPKDGDVPVYSVTLGEEYRNGGVYSVTLSGIALEGHRYLYEADGKLLADPYATRLSGLSDFGVTDDLGQIYPVISQSKYNWKNDKAPMTDARNLIIYKLHARGFTMSPSSKVRNKGTFKGITQKIPYLKELGINAVELMPVYEFDESGKNLNYWGYAGGFYFAPKAAYCVSKVRDKDYTKEFKDMVKSFHDNGMEVYMEFFFPNEAGAGLIDDCIRFWRKEYHIDGAHLICDESACRVIAEDPYLKDMKLFHVNWHNAGKNTNLMEYNEGFENVARCLMKGDEDKLGAFLDAFRKNPKHAGNVNYIADNNGFTLMDLVSYDRKHNEANGENNRDGRDYNFSWNCGEEGVTKSIKIQRLRLKNRKNAMVMLMLAQGVPMIYAGDEFGNSQGGNNNAYCQDNETGWVSWGEMSKNRKFSDFVKAMIAFRKKHDILRLDEELCMSDYKFYGMPDISYHGSKAWYPELEYYNRHVGVMLCGKYAGEDSNIYIAFNLHWEEQELALPDIRERKWKICFSTEEQSETVFTQDRTVIVPPRSITVFTDEKNS